MMRCRACDAEVVPVVDLGEQPPGGTFPRPGDVPAQRMPLRLGVCGGCGLVQLADPSPPEFDDPDGVSPLSSATVGDHARRFVDDLRLRGLATPDSRSLSLASHGGHLAGLLHEQGVPVTVVDPMVERVRRLRLPGFTLSEAGSTSRCARPWPAGPVRSHRGLLSSCPSPAIRGPRSAELRSCWRPGACSCVSSTICWPPSRADSGTQSAMGTRAISHLAGSRARPRPLGFGSSTQYRSLCTAVHSESS